MNTVDDRLRTHYDGYYGSSELTEWRRLGAIDKVKNVEELCIDLRVKSAIDIGCGDGAMIQRLAEIKFAERFQGVDISGSAISLANARSIGDQASFATFDGSHVPFAAEQFDVAVLSHVVEHLEHPRVLLREARRVARHIIVEVPCEHTIRLKRDYSPDPVGHINFYTPVTIRRLLQSTGLTVEKQIVRGCSLDVMRFNRRWSGALAYVVREGALMLVPRVASSFFVYHTALLCH